MLTVAHRIAGLETCGAERMLARLVTTTDPVRFRGDAGLIVGDPDRIVPPREPDALAAAWDRVIALGAEGRRALGAAGRARIAAEYDLGAIVGRYEALYEGIAVS
jgi:glycosyltransferase involved in cell wall biosynthesis